MRVFFCFSRYIGRVRGSARARGIIWSFATFRNLSQFRLFQHFLLKTFGLSEFISTFAKNFKIRYALIMLTRVINNKGNILAERECSHVVMARMSSARMIRKNGEAKKPRTAIVSTKEFLRSISQTGNGSL